MMGKNLFYIIVAALFFAGCAKTPNVNYNAAMHKDVKKIAIVPHKKVKEVDVYYNNHPGEQLGLIGGMAIVAEFSSKTSTYNEAIKSTNFDPNSYFLSRLSKHLKNQKYKVVTLPKDPKREFDHLSTYPEVNTDAYLDLKVRISYGAESPDASYKPTVRVGAKVVKRRDKSIIYDKYLAAGESFYLSQDIDYVGFDEKYSYKDFDTLKQKPSHSVEGIKKALDKVAIRLATSLKRG